MEVVLFLLWMSILCVGAFRLQSERNAAKEEVVRLRSLLEEAVLPPTPLYLPMVRVEVSSNPETLPRYGEEVFLVVDGRPKPASYDGGVFPNHRFMDSNGSVFTGCKSYLRWNVLNE